MKRRDWATSRSPGWVRARSLSLAIDSAVETLEPGTGGSPWFVTSVAAPAPSALSYSPVRSAFSVSERVEQTYETVESIRAVTTLPSIVVVEGSGDESIASRFQGASDVALVRVTDPILREAVDSPYKGLGEAAMLVAIAGSKAATTRGFWKISGRYRVHADILLARRPTGIAGKIREGRLVTVCFGVEAPHVSAFGRRIRRSGLPLMMNRSLEDVAGRYAVGSGLLRELPVTLEGRNGVNGQEIRL